MGMDVKVGLDMEMGLWGDWRMRFMLMILLLGVTVVPTIRRRLRRGWARVGLGTGYLVQMGEARYR